MGIERTGNRTTTALVRALTVTNTGRKRLGGLGSPQFSYSWGPEITLGYLGIRANAAKKMVLEHFLLAVNDPQKLGPHPDKRLGDLLAGENILSRREADAEEHLELGSFDILIRRLEGFNASFSFNSVRLRTSDLQELPSQVLGDYSKGPLQIANVQMHGLDLTRREILSIKASIVAVMDIFTRLIIIDGQKAEDRTPPQPIELVFTNSHFRAPAALDSNEYDELRTTLIEAPDGLKLAVAILGCDDSVYPLVDARIVPKFPLSENARYRWRAYQWPPQGA